MQVGLRPRLKGRPSFYDLIKQRNSDKLSITIENLVKAEVELVASNSPLPVSFTSTKEPALHSLSKPSIEEGSTLKNNQTVVIMVPVCLQSLFCITLTAEDID